MKRKRFSLPAIVIAASLFVSAFASNAAFAEPVAEGEYSAAVSSDSAEKVLNELATVSVKVGNSENKPYNTLDMTFAYDSAKLELKTTELNDFTIEAGEGTVNVKRYGDDSPADTGFDLVFMCKAVGEAQVTLTEAGVDNSDNAVVQDLPGAEILNGGTVTFDIADAAKAQVAFATLSLEGYVRVNYYVKPSAELLQALATDTEAYAQLTYKDVAGDPMILKSWPLNDDGQWVFTQDVAAKEMLEQIVLRLYTGDGKPVVLTNSYNEPITDNAAKYSVARYITTVKADADNTYSDKLKDLAEKLGSYGAYAQTYFDHKNIKKDAGYEDALVKLSLNDVTIDKLTKFKPSKSGSAAGIKNLNITLTLKAGTTLNVIFQLEEGHTLNEYDIAVDGVEDWPVDQNGSWYYISIPNIAAKDLDTPHTITIGENGITLNNCSALSYAYNIVKSYAGNDSKAGIYNLVRALYMYNVSANTYFNDN